MAKTNYIIRTNPAGAPVVGATVDVETASGTPLDSLSTDGNGLAEYTQDGSPGPIVAESTISGRVLRRDGRSMDQMGTWYPYDFPALVRSIGGTYGAGVVPGYVDTEVTTSNNMAVSPGTGRKVNVATGVCWVDGHRYGCTATTALDVTANASGSTRVDRVVVRFTRETQTDAGKMELVVKVGTASPPSVTKDATVTEYSLAQVQVLNGASSFVSGNITDERYSTALAQAYFPTIPVLTSGDLLYANASGQLARLAKGTDGQHMTVASGLPAWATMPTSSIIVQEGDVTKVATANTLDFLAAHFNVSESPSNEANIEIGAAAIGQTELADNAVTSAKIVNGTITGADIATATVTSTNLAAAIDATKIADGSVSNTEFQCLDGVTSNIQAQLNAAGTGGSILPLANSAVKGYASTTVNTTAVTIVSCTIGPLVNGVVYLVEAQSDMQGSAGSGGGSELTGQVRIGSGGTTVDGTKTQTVSGERWIGAFTSETITGTGASVTCSARATSTVASAGVNDARIIARATPKSLQ